MRLLLMFIFLSQIDIGASSFDFENHCRIDSGYEMLGDTCRITLPQNITFGKRDFTEVVKKGMPVSVQLGYRSDFDSEALGLKLYFKGYVDQTGTKTPFTIDCVDEMFTLRQAAPLNLNYPNGVTLKQLLNDVAPGYKHEVDQTITLGPLRIEETNAIGIFNDLANQGVYFYFIPPTSLYFKNKPYEPVLRAGLAYLPMYRRVRMAITENIKVGGDGTEYTEADKQKLVIKAVSNRKDNTKLVYYYPPALKGKAETRTINAYNVSQSALQRIAEEEHRKFTREGYTGTLGLAVGVPQIAHGDIAVYDNAAYASKNGDYIIDHVSVEAGASVGIKPTCTLGGKAGNIKRT